MVRAKLADTSDMAVPELIAVCLVVEAGLTDGSHIAGAVLSRDSRIPSAILPKLKVIEDASLRPGNRVFEAKLVDVHGVEPKGLGTRRHGGRSDQDGGRGDNDFESGLDKHDTGSLRLVGCLEKDRSKRTEVNKNEAVSCLTRVLFAALRNVRLSVSQTNETAVFSVFPAFHRCNILDISGIDRGFDFALSERKASSGAPCRCNGTLA